MIRIDRDKLEEGMLVTGRNPTSLFGKAIRAGVHSFNNHNAMVVRATSVSIKFLEEAGILMPDHGIEPGDLCIGEAKPPFSTLTPISDYEQIMNEDNYLVGFYRHTSLTPVQSRMAAEFFVRILLGLPYPKKSRMIVLAMPFYNMLADRGTILPSIRMNWCSQLCKRAYLSVSPHCLDGLNGKKKDLFSPKTFDNRILQQLFALVEGIVI